MRRINLDTPYEDFIEKMVDAGYYSTTPEVIRDALRKKMGEMEDDRIALIHAMVMEGKQQIEKGMYKVVDQNLLVSVLKRGKANVKADAKILPHIMP